VGGPAVVVGDVLADRVGRVGVAEPLEDSLKLFLREKEEQQYGVGLLRKLIAIGVVSLGSQDAV
jgi:hypothetical protein